MEGPINGSNKSITLELGNLLHEKGIIYLVDCIGALSHKSKSLRLLKQP